MKIKLKKIGRWIAIALVALILFSLFSGKSNVLRMSRSISEIKNKEAVKAEWHRTIDSLKTQNMKLGSGRTFDTAYIEKIAREKLGMVRKDEKVYKFIEETK